MIIIKRASLWAESIFHVLAHVNPGPFASSCFDPVYSAWIAAKLGSAADRELFEDARVIANAATSHDVLARAQALAWVFDDEADLERVRDHDLASLGDVDVKNAQALTLAKSAGLPLAEVLRASAELELPLLASLAWDDVEMEAVTDALASILAAAPHLPKYEIALTRPLGIRGRSLGLSILVGVPGIACPNADHIAWQAAHEATVAEIINAKHVTAFEDIERRAIGLLRSRARRAGLDKSHALWLSRFDVSALGSIPDIENATE